MLVFLP